MICEASVVLRAVSRTVKPRWMVMIEAEMPRAITRVAIMTSATVKPSRAVLSHRRGWMRRVCMPAVYSNAGCWQRGRRVGISGGIPAVLFGPALPGSFCPGDRGLSLPALEESGLVASGLAGEQSPADGLE